MNWVKNCCFKFCTKARSPFVSSENFAKSDADTLFCFLAFSKIPLNAFSTLLACLLNPSLTTWSAKGKYSASIICFILGLMAIAACNSISLPSCVGKMWHVTLYGKELHVTPR